MKKLVLVVAVILGMTATSQGQEYYNNKYNLGDSVCEVSNVIQVLDMSIENMVFANVKSCKVVNVYELIEDSTWVEPKYIPTLLGTKMKFQVTDDKWNYLDITFYLDLDANVFVKGKFNGKPFTSNINTNNLIYDDTDEIVPNVEWNLR
jgi:hypothetical protein